MSLDEGMRLLESMCVFYIAVCSGFSFVTYPRDYLQLNLFHKGEHVLMIRESSDLELHCQNLEKKTLIPTLVIFCFFYNERF